MKNFEVEDDSSFSLSGLSLLLFRSIDFLKSNRVLIKLL